MARRRAQARASGERRATGIAASQRERRLVRNLIAAVGDVSRTQGDERRRHAVDVEDVVNGGAVFPRAARSCGRR